jgi:hypothetical protein
VIDGERGLTIVDEDPIGAMRLESPVRFGLRAAALSGASGGINSAGPGLFDSRGTFGPFPTCSSFTR